MYINLKDPAFQFLRDAFEDYMFENWPSLINRRNQRFRKITLVAHSRITIKQMAGLTGATPAFIKQLIRCRKLSVETVLLPSGRQVRLLHINKKRYVKELYAETLCLGQVALLIQLSEERVRQLIEGNVLPILVSKKTVQTAQWFISKSAVSSLQFKSASVHGNCVLLKQILKHWHVDAEFFVAMTKAIVSQQLRVFSEQKNTVLLGEVWLDRQEAQDWLLSHRETVSQMLSVNETCKRLGVKQEVVYHLVRRKIMDSTKDAIGNIKVKHEHIDKFKKKYISLSVLASAMHTSEKSARTQLTAYPVCGPNIDGCRQYFYFKKDVKKLWKVISNEKQNQKTQSRN